jgi:hypothetical protein
MLKSTKGTKVERYKMETSVDMIRLRVRVSVDEMQEYIERFENDPDVEYWNDRRYKKYHHNFTFHEMLETPKKNSKGRIINSEASFYLGYQNNAEKKSNKYFLVLEYNPNKCAKMLQLFNILLRWFGSPLVEVVSADIATDIHCNIMDLFYSVKTKGGVVHKTFDYGGDNKTYYIGEGDYRKKIYNKRREANLDYELTRFEISVPVKIYLKCMEEFKIPLDKIPILYSFKNYQTDMFINGTDRAIIFAIMHGFPIKEIERTKREKIEKILSQTARIPLDSIVMEHTLKNYLRQLYNSIHIYD